MDHPVRAGEIAETPSKENAFCYLIVTDDGQRISLRGLGAPKGGAVGDRGTVQYQRGAGFGLYFWSPEATD